jgi:hypothetical protein
MVCVIGFSLRLANGTDEPATWEGAFAEWTLPPATVAQARRAMGRVAPRMAFMVSLDAF